MTIAAGFLCTDGILLASDTLYSGQNKRYGRKIWVIQETPITAAIAGAGGSVVMRRVRDETLQRLRARPATNRDEIIACIDSVLYQLSYKHKAKADEFPLSLLVAFRDETGCALYESNGAAVVAQTDRLGVCLGWGASLGLYFMDSLNTVKMPLYWTRVVAAHLIKHCKTYVDSCGGDTHILELPTVEGEVRFMEDQSAIAQYEQHFAEIDNVMRMVLPDGRADDATLEHRITTLNEAIRTLRKSYVILVGGGSYARKQRDVVIEDDVPRKNQK